MAPVPTIDQQYPSMSAPTSSFSKLSISPNMSSSAEPSRALPDIKGKGKELVAHDEAPEDETTHIFALDHCRESENGYAFQIARAELKYYGVRIRTTGSRWPTCSCGQQQCGHIDWLLAQLSSAQDQDEPTLNAKDIISSAGGLANVCAALQWELRDGETESDWEETGWKLEKIQSGRSVKPSRITAIRDLLSVLSPTGNFRHDILIDPDQITMEAITGDWEATVASVLALDDHTFHEFSKILSGEKNLLAVDYFRQAGERARKTLEMMDEWCEFGPRTRQSEQKDVAWCAQILANIVDEIQENINQRQPLIPAAREEAARVLIELLTNIVHHRNVDAYAGAQWQRRPRHGETTSDRNLYQRLIASSTSPAGAYFILKVLQDLPEARQYLSELEAVVLRLGQPAWSSVPPAYTLKLRNIITSLKMSLDQILASTGKRPAEGTGRESSKRMK